MRDDTANSVRDETPLGPALEATERELEWLDEEVEAFEAFLDSVETIRTRAGDADGTSRPSSLPAAGQEFSADPAPFEAVRDAFEETVFAVDHWESAYSERTVPEAMESEFSAELAEVLRRPRGTEFSPFVANKLRAEVEEAVHDRTRSRDFVAEEATHLRTLAAELGEVLELVRFVVDGDGSFEDRRAAVETAYETLEELAETHQAYLAGCEDAAERLLTGMVYADLETEYPGLSAVASVRRTVDRANGHFWAGLL
ncbi:MULTISPECIES: DUF7260 family protein [Halorussus]|uniref:DUF7260 family protein n=1 Tax=Halorussus TaxID=1070314 RepID=UPI00209D4882|nr:hypothetical protein [Halorussus vallis]USZ77945.1 hypothetical protein NGM07_22475 [Halorussus vallis]